MQLKAGTKRVPIQLLFYLSTQAARDGLPELAATLSGAARQLQTALETGRVAGADVDRTNRHADRLRTALGKERFEELQAEGAQMSLDQAVELALDRDNWR